MNIGTLLFCWVFGDLGTSVKFSIIWFDNVLTCIFLIKTIPSLNQELRIASQTREILPKNYFIYIDFRGLTLNFKKRCCDTSSFCFFKNFMNTLIPIWTILFNFIWLTPISKKSILIEKNVMKLLRSKIVARIYNFVSKYNFYIFDHLKICLILREMKILNLPPLSLYLKMFVFSQNQ